MSAIKSALNINILSKLFTDENLTKKAYLNAVASGLDYAARLVVGFILTPWLVVGLGTYSYGLWQILNRMVGYLTPASGRPAFALKWTLANQQASTDYDQKRQHVGSALVVWVIFLPIMGVIGGVLAWFVPYWIKDVPAEYFWEVRIVTGILVANLVIGSLTNIPQSVLQGENLGYKRMGMSAALVIVGGGLTWLALYLNIGIAGVAAAALITTLLTGLFFLLIVRSYAPWFGVARPSSQATRWFLGLSGWFMGWNLVMSLMEASDVVLLGILGSVESVTTYTLTKYVPETLISIIAIMAFGIAPGLGGIIGSGKFERASQLRGEIMAFTWLISTTLGATILVWNRAFLGLWVGGEYSAGSLPTLLVIVLVTQFVFIRNDASIIDLSLNLQQKVLIGALSVILSIVMAGFLVGYLQLGIIGLCLGIAAGRLILSLGYPYIVGGLLKVSLSSQFKSSIRPAIVTIILFLLAMGLENQVRAHMVGGLSGWIRLILFACLTALIISCVSFLGGLTSRQRRSILNRIRIVTNFQV